MIFFVGLIKISVNGKLIKEEKETFFENSFLLRPITLNGNNFSENKANLSHLCLLIFNTLCHYLWCHNLTINQYMYVVGKITLMKSRATGFWYQAEIHISNVNIFRIVHHIIKHAGHGYSEYRD